MPYFLLTGATGLLGQYLLREALLKRLPVVVLVRPLPNASGRQRIEAVLQRVEEELGRAMPRPVVIEGQLDQPGLGLPPRDRQWLAENCGSVIHSAASITFYTDQRSGEPYRSNVTGMQHLLQLCRECEIGEFHYVSTAYVCGQRSGQILEHDLDVGQMLGNDYERSKFEAETLLRKEKFPTPPTIYRPSIIVGDSKTGYTSAFHGVYAALRVFWQLAQADAAWGNPRVPFAQQLDLRGDERKNLVPVDWAAAAIMHIVQHPQHHGQTYHVAHPTPAAVKTIGQAFGDAVAACMPPSAPGPMETEPTALAAGPDDAVDQLVRPEASAYRSEGPEAGAYRSEGPEASAYRSVRPEAGAYRSEGPEASAYRSVRPEAGAYRSQGSEAGACRSEGPEAGAYRSQGPEASSPERGEPQSHNDRRTGSRSGPTHLAMQNKDELRQSLGVYEAYFRDDPEFDTRNLQRAVPHLPCPRLEYEQLKWLAECAIQSNFGWPRRPPPELAFDFDERLQPLMNSDARSADSRGLAPSRLQLELSGPGGGAWTITFADNYPVSAEWGIGAEKGAGAYATVATFLAILRGEIACEEAIAHGRLVVTGDASDFTHGETLLAGLDEYLHAGAMGVSHGGTEARRFNEL